MLNVARAGLFKTLREMGARIEELERRIEGGEDVADRACAPRRSKGWMFRPSARRS